MFLLPSQLTTFYRQANTFDLPANVFGSDIPNSQILIDSCTDNANGLFFTSIGLLTDFRPKYIENFKQDEFVGTAAQAYDFATLVGNNFNKTNPNKLTGKKIIDKLKTNINIQGVTGSYSFTNSNSNGMAFDMPIGLRTVKEKKIIDMY